MTREHKAWVLLKERVESLNGFAGNRSEMHKFTKMVERAWDEAGKEQKDKEADVCSIGLK